MTESVSDNYAKKNFSLLMAETGISAFATSLFTILILWIAKSETKSALITGIAGAMLVAPLIISIVVGAFIDRARRASSSPLILAPDQKHSFDVDCPNGVAVSRCWVCATHVVPDIGPEANPANPQSPAPENDIHFPSSQFPAPLFQLP